MKKTAENRYGNKRSFKLNRETVRTLTDEEASEVVGAGSSVSFQYCKLTACKPC